MRRLAHTELDASWGSGRPAAGVMGNSEVGHLTIGSGRVIYQDLMRITKAIATGEFARTGFLSTLLGRRFQPTLHFIYGTAFRRQRA